MALERIGLQDIEAGYKMYKDCPYYAIFERLNATSAKLGRLVYAYKEGDRNQGWEELKQNLQALEARAPEAPHLLLFYQELSKGNRIDSNTPYDGSFVFRMRPYSYAPAINGVPGGMQDNNFLQYLQTELRLEKEKTQELEIENEELKAELEAYEKEPKVPISGIIGQVGEACNQYPALANILQGWSDVLKNKIFSPPQQQYRQPAGTGGIAGVATDVDYKTKISQAQRILMEWYAKEYGDIATEEGRLKGAEVFADDLLALANLTKNTFIMKSALSNLRSIKVS